jgi:CxxC-x17-CxxC domain-containing protein
VSKFQDRTLRCSDCGNTFNFTANEQTFYAERSFSDPKRCPSCRAARKAARSGGASSRGSGSPRRDRGGQGPRQMYDIICDDCGQPAQVPFKPRDDRPVYCRDCYANRR